MTRSLLVIGLSMAAGALGATWILRPPVRELAPALSPSSPDAAADPAQGAATSPEGESAPSPGSDDALPSHATASVALPSDDHEVVDGFRRVDPDRVPGARMLETQWGIEMYEPDSDEWSTPGRTGGRRATPDAENRLALRFSGALEVYPPSYVQRLGLRRVMVVEEFRHKGVQAAMIAMGPYGTIAADAEAGARAPGGIHHELYHLADYRMFGRPARAPAWDALNPRGFRYHGSGRLMTAERQNSGARAADIDALSDSIPGFVSLYSTADADEDRAELFKAMVTAPDFISRRQTADPVLRAKIAFLKQALADWEPSMDERFWAAIAGR